MLSTDLCECSNTYIVVKEAIDLLVAAANEMRKAHKNAASKNNAPHAFKKLTVHWYTIEKISI